MARRQTDRQRERGGERERERGGRGRERERDYPAVPDHQLAINSSGAELGGVLAGIGSKHRNLTRPEPARERECVCVRERECVCVRERESERERREGGREREREERGREREREERGREKQHIYDFSFTVIHVLNLTILTLLCYM